ncbi:MAG: hypothetical protein NZ937_01375 [Armatimonadetes bacterium]|nr:hypothetical protein [Armatimonadota bacterium]
MTHQAERKDLWHNAIWHFLKILATTEPKNSASHRMPFEKLFGY